MTRLVSIAALLFAAPLATVAHHSVTFYSDEVIEIAGELTRIEWRNPHIRLTLEATERTACDFCARSGRSAEPRYVSGFDAANDYYGWSGWTSSGQLVLSFDALGALLVTSSVGVLDAALPVFKPMLLTDLMMPDNRLPVQLYLAGQDRIIDNPAVEAVLGKGKDYPLDLVTYADQTHSIQFDAPDRLARDISRWLKTAVP